MAETTSGYQVNSSAENTSLREINFEEIIQIILRRKIGVAIIVVISIIGGILYYLSQTPEYHATSILIINEPPSSAKLVDALLSSGSAADSKIAQKDVELLESLPIAELTVRNLWNSEFRDSLELFDKRPYISPARKLIKWLIPIRKIQKFDTTFQPDTPMYDDLMRMYALRLKGRIRVLSSRATSILRVSVASPYKDESVLLTNMLSEVYKKSDVQRNSERYVQTNRFVAEMLKEQKELLFKADEDLSDYMIKNKIYEVTGNTQMLLSKLVELDSKYRDAMVEYRILKNTRDFIDKKLSQNDRNVSDRIFRVINIELGNIQDDIRTKEREYIKLSSEKGAKNEDIIDSKKELDKLKEQYEQISRNKIAGQIAYAGTSQKYSYDLISEKLILEHKLNNINYSANEYNKLKLHYESQLGELPNKEQSFVRLMREREVVSQTYLYLKQKLDESRILIGSEVGSVTMIGSAFKPFVPESPELNRNIFMGFVVGLVISVIYVFSAEILDDRINYDTLFFKSLGFNIWGIVPLIPSFNVTSKTGLIESFANKIKTTGLVNGKKNGKIAPPIINTEQQEGTFSYPMMTDKLNSSFAESFRTLRTNLAFARIDKPMKKLVISGCSIGEGKSTVCANLAMAWAVADKKTIIIDADLRRPSQHRIFKKSRALGLSDCLVNNDLEINDRYIHKTQIDNLYLMSAGSPVPNPNELLGSDRMRTLLDNLSQNYERLIIDSPPVFISDAAQLLDMVDGVLIAVRLGYSSKFTLKQYAYDSFIHSHIVGVVLVDNERPTKGLTDKGYSRYGYTSYGSYGESYVKK